MKNEKTRILLITILLLFTLGLQAQASYAEDIIIKSVDELKAKSTLDQNEKLLVLIPGNPSNITELIKYMIVLPIDISGYEDFNSLSLNDNNLTLEIDKKDNADVYLLKADKFVFGNNGGIFELRGGKSITGDAENSVAVFNSIIQNRGKLNAYGGSGKNSHGLIVDSIYLYRGSINALGGSGENALGVKVETIEQRNTSLIRSSGNSDSTSSLGIIVTSINQYDNSKLEVTGGGGTEESSSYGMVAEVVNQNGNSNIKAEGGSAINAYGLKVDTINQHGKSIVNAIGNEISNKNSSGIFAGTINQYDESSILADGNIGGKGLEVSAINQYNKGLIVSNGSKSDPSSLLNPVNINSGISVTTLTQNDSSTVRGYGGGGTNTHGIYISSAMQRGSSTILGQGSSAADKSAYGAYINSLVQESAAASLIAIGGTGTNNYGIYIDTDVVIKGSLNINRIGNSASLYVNGNMKMAENSQIIANMNLADPQNKSGLISAKSVEFERDVVLRPVIANTYSFSAGDSGRIKFLDVRGGGITSKGSFNLLDKTITFSYIHDIDDDGYYLHIGRDKTPGKAFSDAKASGIDITDNQIQFVDKLFELARGDSHSFANVLSEIDNFTTIDAATNYVNRFLKSFSPQTLPLWREIGVREMTQSQLSLDEKIKNYSLEQTNQIWMSPTYSFGKYKAEGVDFEELKESAFGISLGAIYKKDNISLALEGQFIKTNIESAENTSTGIGYGGIAAFDYKFSQFKKFNPNIRLSVSYKYRDIGIKIDNITGEREADTKENTYMIGLALGHDFEFFNRLKLDLQIGLNYTNMKFDAYSEAEDSFIVEENNLKSLEGNLRFGADFKIIKSLSISARGMIAYEFLNPFMSGYTNIGAYEAFELEKTTRSYSKLSYDAGIGLIWQASSYLNIKVGYDFYSRGLYSNNKIKLDFKVQF